MRYLITLEETNEGFSVQVPDLAIITFGKNIEEAKNAAIKAIEINLEAYTEANQKVPEGKSISDHMKDQDFDGVLFAYVNMATSKVAA